MLMTGGFNVVAFGVDVTMNVSKVMHAEFEYMRDAIMPQSRIRPGENERFRQSDAYRMSPADSLFDVSI
jgi:hypothetical protein